MAFVITNLDEIEYFVKNLNIDNHLSGWMSKFLKKEIIVRRNWLILTNLPSSLDEHVQKAIDLGENIFSVKFSDNMISEVRHVTDWITELEQRDPRLFSKLDRINWKQAVEHSNRWHEALARRAEKVKAESIPFDDDCPVMFTHDDGMKWVWLKTDKARDDEGRIMGHCVGNGGYDDLDYRSGVFSLRDSSGRPHVTVEILKGKLCQAVTHGNLHIPDKYKKHVKIFQEFMYPKMSLLPRKEGVDHIVWWNGDETWYLDEKLHRDGGPSFICFDGRMIWHRNGFVVQTYKNKSMSWYDEHGKLHRECGPAVIKEDGTKWWLRHDEFHREDGPAIIDADGTKHWLVGGHLHRIDGPAVEKISGDREWWVRGKLVKRKLETRIEWIEDNELSRNGKPAVIYENGDEIWYWRGNLHREDGPAIEYSNGDREWYFNGRRHRDDGPSIECVNGKKEWYRHGKLHRDDGPAVIKSSGDMEWYMEGVRHRIDGPAVDRIDGTREWWLNGALHREDGPARIWSGGEEWFDNGHPMETKR